MTEPETPEDDGVERLDDPNKQVLGLEPAWAGDHTEAPVEEEPEAGVEAEVSAEDNTKDELLAYAHQIGASPANAGMTKDELQASIDAKLAEGEDEG